MRKFFTLLSLLFLPVLLWAQSVVVPKNIYFADIKLEISDEAQQEIQKKVDALHRSPAYFKKKVELADAYFPLIERTFKELGVPEDLKYLALQESGLIGDAVSSSNAVGYWQFKREAASDFNLQVNHLVDERKHIVEASKGAAKYFLRSNTYYNNWFNTILSYYLGYSGAKAYTKPSDNGSRKMEVTDKTNHYLLTFLAHKVAYENFVGKANTVSIKELRATPGQSLAEIALEHKTDPSELEKYNKWLLGSTIPSDKEYFVMVPVRLATKDQVILASNDDTNIINKPAAKQNRAATIVKQNGLNALVARAGDTKDILALQAGISTRKFLKYNDMHNFDKIVAGDMYYIEPKHRSASTEYHVVQSGETTQEISQKYGMKLSQLLFKNRMARNEVPVPGRVLWLQHRRPHSTPVEVKDPKSKQGTTAGAVTPGSKATPIATTNKTASSTSQTEPEAPAKDNIFKRFIRSFDRFKKKPAATASDKNPESETTSQSREQTAVEAAPTEESNVITEVKEPAAKTKDPILYPGKKPAATPEKKQEVATKAEAETMVIDSVETTVAVIQKEEPEVITPAPAQQPAVKSTHHTVKQGETLYSISRLYATTVSNIVSWNNLGETPIKIGQELLIAEPLKTPETIPAQQPEEDIVPVQASTEFHTVVTGETLYQISKKYNVSLAELQRWNNLPDNTISIGQKLRVSAPASDVAEDEVTPAKTEIKPAATNTSVALYHTVAAGESMYQISRKYDVTIKDIMQWNNKSDFNVSFGEKLLIKKK